MFGKLFARFNDAGTGIQKYGVIQNVYLNAGRVAADFKCGRAGNGDAAPDAMKGEAEVVSHVRYFSWTSRYVLPACLLFQKKRFLQRKPWILIMTKKCLI